MDSASTLFLGVALIIVMLGMGLTLIIKDFKRVLLYPKAIVIGLFNQIIILPLIGFGIIKIIPMHPEIAVGIMILAACPGGPTSNLYSYLAKADLALSVTLTAISSLITIVTIPFVINFALRNLLEKNTTVTLDVWQTVIQVAVIIVIPVFVGMLIRHYKPDFATKMARPVKIISAVVLAVIIIALILKEKENILTSFQEVGLAALLLNVGTMLFGYFSARMFKLNKPQSLSISIESGIQNGTLAITIAIVLLNNSTFAIAPGVYSLIMFLTGGFIIYYGTRNAKIENGVNSKNN